MPHKGGYLLEDPQNVTNLQPDNTVGVESTWFFCDKDEPGGGGVSGAGAQKRVFGGDAAVLDVAVFELELAEQEVVWWEADNPCS